MRRKVRVTHSPPEIGDELLLVQEWREWDWKALETRRHRIFLKGTVHFVYRDGRFQIQEGRYRFGPDGHVQGGNPKGRVWVARVGDRWATPSDYDVVKSRLNHRGSL